MVNSMRTMEILIDQDYEFSIVDVALKDTIKCRDGAYKGIKSYFGTRYYFAKFLLTSDNKVAYIYDLCPSRKYIINMKKDEKFDEICNAIIYVNKESQKSKITLKAVPMGYLFYLIHCFMANIAKFEINRWQELCGSVQAWRDGKLWEVLEERHRTLRLRIDGLHWCIDEPNSERLAPKEMGMDGLKLFEKCALNRDGKISHLSGDDLPHPALYRTHRLLHEKCIFECELADGVQPGWRYEYGEPSEYDGSRKKRKKRGRQNEMLQRRFDGMRFVGNLYDAMDKIRRIMKARGHFDCW